MCRNTRKAQTKWDHLLAKGKVIHTETAGQGQTQNQTEKTLQAPKETEANKRQCGELAKGEVTDVNKQGQR